MAAGSISIQFYLSIKWPNELCNRVSVIVSHFVRIHLLQLVAISVYDPSDADAERWPKQRLEAS